MNKPATPPSVLKYCVGCLVVVMLSLMGLLCVSSGCQGAPQYAGLKSKSDNELNLGWGRSLRLGAETDATLEGMTLASGSKIDKLVLKQSPGSTMSSGWVPAMDAYGRQQVNFVPILKQYGDNAIGITNAVFNGISQVAQIAMPVVGQAVAGHYSVAEAKVKAGDMRSELINAIGGGLIGPVDAKKLADSLPVDVSDVFNNPIVKARMDELEAELKRLREAQPQ